jgi:hypothetical protein
MTDQPVLRKYYYVMGKQTFEELPDGNVRVTADDGQTGVFTWKGQFIEGELTTVNAHMLSYTGGPNLPKACNFKWIEMPVDVNRPTGWPEELEPYMQHQIGKR